MKPARTDRRDQDVGLRVIAARSAVFRMADGDRAVFAQQQAGHRFADDVAPPDDDGVLAGHGMPLRRSSSITPAGVADTKPG
jgi:hypothetical protein